MSNNKPNPFANTSQTLRKMGGNSVILYSELEGVALEIENIKSGVALSERQVKQTESVVTEIRSWKSEADGGFVFEDWAERLSSMGSPGVDPKPAYYDDLNQFYKT